MNIFRLSVTTLLAVFLLAAGLWAQDKQLPEGEPASLIGAQTYPFSIQLGIPLADMSRKTTLLIPGGLDNASTGLMPIGFLFRFDGANYSTFSASGNGLIRLGEILTGNTDQNTINSTAYSPKILPYWDDICVGNGGMVHYKTSGLPGGRTMVIEWRNMNVRRGLSACDGSGTGTFQLWLSEGSGVIRFVYGVGMVDPVIQNGGYSVGIQSGGATNFASVTTWAGTVSYTTGNNMTVAGIAAGTSYLFTPRLPAAPTLAVIGEVTQTTVRLDWADNADNETGYLIRRSTDGVSYSEIGMTPPNATSFTDAGLTPNSMYFYKLNSVTEGGISPDIDLSAAALPRRSFLSTEVGGLWSSPSTWSDGIVPASGDDVVIVDGATVIIDTASAAFNLTVGGEDSASKDPAGRSGTGGPAVLRFGENAGYSLTVAFNVTIRPGCTLSTGNGNANTHVLTLGGDLTNDGTLDLSTNNNLAAASLVFKGNSSNTFGGSGPVNDIAWISVDKGNSSTNILELSTANFTVQGSDTNTSGLGFLFLNHGTFKISGSFPLTSPTFYNAPYGIATGAGFWLNNPTYTVTARHQAMVEVYGILRITAGTYNVGTDLDDSLVYFQGSTVVIEGGFINTAGRLANGTDGAFNTTYSQTGGRVTTCIVGQGATNSACWDSGDYPARTAISLAAGEIVIQNSPLQCCVQAFRYRNLNYPIQAESRTIVFFGNSSSSQVSEFRVTGSLPNMVIDTSAGNHKVRPYLGSALNVEIQPGGTLILQPNSSYGFRGSSFVNNGTISGDGTDPYIHFNGTNQIYSGSGTIDRPLNTMGLNCVTLTIDSVNSVRTRQVTFIAGRLINSGNVILGNNDGIESSVGFHGGLLSPSGLGFDSPPIFELGTGGESVSYTVGPMTTGPEINPERKLSSLRLDAPAGLTVAGGDLTARNLTLIWGVVNTGLNKLTHTGTFYRENGYINGMVVRPFAGPETYTFPIGQSGYSPVTAEISSSGPSPSSLGIATIAAPRPYLLVGNSLSRYWKLEETGELIAKITFTYQQLEVRGNEPDYQLWFSTSGPPVIIPGAVLSTGNNTMVTPFIMELTGDWGIGAQLDPSPVSISGNVTTAGGQPIRNATLVLTGGNLPSPVTVQTGNFGTYSFTGLQAGEGYTVRVDVKRYRFAQPTLLVTPFGNVGNVNFVANPQE